MQCLLVSQYLLKATVHLYFVYLKLLNIFKLSKASSLKATSNYYVNYDFSKALNSIVLLFLA